MKNRNIKLKTLEELENDYWEPLSAYPTGMIKEIYDLRKKKIGVFEVNDLRLLIEQNIGRTFLIPEAMEKLKINILQEGVHYPGDLLMSLLNVESGYWEKNTLQKEQFMNLLINSREVILASKEINEKIKSDLIVALTNFH